MRKSKAISFMILASLFWSIAGLFIKQISWHPIVIAGLRSLIAGCFMLIFLRRDQIKINRTVRRGAFVYMFVAGLFVIANKLTTSTNAILLQFTAPIWVVIFSTLFLKQRMRAKDLLVVSVVLGGMVLFFLGDLEFGGILGNILAILAGVAVAVMILVMQSDAAINPLLIATLGNFLLFIVTLPALVVFPIDITLHNVANLLILGVFQLGLGYVMFSKAVQHVSSLEAALTMVIEPLLNPLWVMIFLGERPTIYAVIGGAIVLIAIVIYQVTDIRRVTKRSSKTPIQ